MEESRCDVSCIPLCMNGSRQRDVDATILDSCYFKLRLCDLFPQTLTVGSNCWKEGTNVNVEAAGAEINIWS